MDDPAAAALLGRRYGVPPSMVERATQRRLTGDWRGACAAARFDIRFDVDRAARQYGAEVAAALDADLHQLVPDLVHWHAPRRGRYGLLAPGRVVVLADYHESMLTAHLPRINFGPQRMELHLGPGPAEDDRQRDDWTAARYLWNARETPALLRRMGGGDRTPFFHRDGTPRTPDRRPRDRVWLVERVLMLQDAGRVVESWETGGIPPVQEFADSVRNMSPSEFRLPEPVSAMVPQLVPVATAMLAIPSGRDGVVLRAGGPPDRPAVLLMLGDTGLRAHQISGNLVTHLPAVPRVLWQRMPDLELLRTGQIEADELHPLVRAALFPEQPDPGYHPHMPKLSSLENRQVTIDCSGSRHRIGLAGHIMALDHTDEQVVRERVLRSLGAAAAPCVEAVDIWRGRRHGRLPPELDELRIHGAAVLAHANVDGLHRLLDAGVDPAGFRDEVGGGPLHHLAEFAAQDDAIAAQLLDAGLDINARDKYGRSALHYALALDAPADLIDALRAAGAVD